MNAVEHELDEFGVRTGRWRARQFYANRAPSGKWLRDSPKDRKSCEWREKKR